MSWELLLFAGGGRVSGIPIPTVPVLPEAVRRATA